MKQPAQIKNISTDRSVKITKYYSINRVLPVFLCLGLASFFGFHNNLLDSVSSIRLEKYIISEI